MLLVGFHIPKGPANNYPPPNSHGTPADQQTNVPCTQVENRLYRMLDFYIFKFLLSHGAQCQSFFPQLSVVVWMDKMRSQYLRPCYNEIQTYFNPVSFVPHMGSLRCEPSVLCEAKYIGSLVGWGRAQTGFLSEFNTTAIIN